MANIQSLPFLLKDLRLTAIAKHWQITAQKAVREQWEPELFLAELCELEMNHRHETRLKRLLKESKLPTGKQLHQYKFDEIEVLGTKTQTISVFSRLFRLTSQTQHLQTLLMIQRA